MYYVKTKNGIFEYPTLVMAVLKAKNYEDFTISTKKFPQENKQSGPDLQKRIREKYSLKDFAKKIDVNMPYLSRVLGGRVKLTRDMREKIIKGIED